MFYFKETRSRSRGKRLACVRACVRLRLFCIRENVNGRDATTIQTCDLGKQRCTIKIVDKCDRTNWQESRRRNLREARFPFLFSSRICMKEEREREVSE